MRAGAVGKREEEAEIAGAGPLAAARRALRRLAGERSAGGPFGGGGAGGPNGGRADEQRGPLAAFQRYNRAYFRRWLVIGALIGVVAGVGAILFAAAIAFCTNLLLGQIAGFFPPQPAGEATALNPFTAATLARRWVIPLVTTLGGLLTGLIVFTFAPEAEGHGTDAAIQAFHDKGGRIRARIPLVKLVASAMTIGSGGSAGREGPTAQISAGFGSWLGGVLRLDDHDRRIAEAAGIGAGIGAIFKAPFGGALLSAEILYKRDFEADALFPSFIASVIGFTIYGAWAGWTPIFGAGAHFQFTNPLSLVGYLILGLVAGGVGLLYPKTLYGVRDLFHRVKLPRFLKPAIGGLLVGLIGIWVPQALGMGYGYVQFGINNDFTHIAAWLMAALVLIKILTTSLTIGSGGSGGVFGPGMVIGGFLGGALWAGLHAVVPGLVAGANAGAFVVVGMGAFFGGIAKAPLAIILMVAEMTGEFSLIAPAMLATMVAYLVTGETSIYESQVPTRLDSPAHKHDYALPLLQNVPVRDAMVAAADGSVATAGPEATLDVIAALIRERHVISVPIIAEGRLIGLVTASDLARVPPEDAAATQARQVMSRAVIRAYPDESLYAAWLRMSRRGLRQLAVAERGDPGKLLGIITMEGVARVLRPHGLAAGGAAAGSAAAGYGAISGHTGDDDEADAESEAAEEDVEGVEGVAPDRNGAHARGDASAEADPLARLRVRDAMLATPRLLRVSEPVSRARALLEERGAALMVVDGAGRLVGIVTRADLRERPDGVHGVHGVGGREPTVGEVAVRNVVTARPDESLRAAAQRMGHAGLRQLPVVEHPLPAPPVGLLRRSDVLLAYERAVGGTTGADVKAGVKAAAPVGGSDASRNGMRQG